MTSKLALLTFGIIRGEEAIRVSL
jgi:hypothetical protein